MGLNIKPEHIDAAKAESGSYEQIIFPEKSIVEFLCLDIEENKTYQTINMKCKVLSGQHKDKRRDIRISLKEDHEIQNKKRARWALAFWTEEELKKDEPVSLARLIGRRFQARAEKPREWNGKTYQDFDYFKDLGEAGDAAEPTTFKTSSRTDQDIPF